MITVEFILGKPARWVFPGESTVHHFPLQLFNAAGNDSQVGLPHPAPCWFTSAGSCKLTFGSFTTQWLGQSQPSRKQQRPDLIQSCPTQTCMCFPVHPIASHKNSRAEILMSDTVIFFTAYLRPCQCHLGFHKQPRFPLGIITWHHCPKWPVAYSKMTTGCCLVPLNTSHSPCNRSHFLSQDPGFQT